MHGLMRGLMRRKFRGRYATMRGVSGDQERGDKEELEQLLIDSLNSGEPIEITREMIEDVRRKLRARAKGRTSTKS